MSTFKELVVAKGKVYLASPWFNDEQFERCETIRDIIKDCGFNVFSPKDECLVSADADQDWRKTAFEGNINAINKASFLVAITDGKDVGTIFECGAAYAKNVPVIYFAETLGENQFNLMLAQSGVLVVRNRDDLIKVLNDEEVMKAILTNTVYENYTGKVQ